MVDIVTNRNANLHNELVQLLNLASSYSNPSQLYSISYRPIRGEDSEKIEVWQRELAVGTELPTLPLTLCSDMRLSFQSGEAPDRLPVIIPRACKE